MHNHTYRHKHLIPAISTVVPPEKFVQQLGHQQVIQQDLRRPGRPGPSKDTAPEFGHSQRFQALQQIYNHGWKRK